MNRLLRKDLGLNEGWLLRLILDSFSGHSATDHPLAFAPGARWFSEALLPSAFLPRHRGDPLGEAHTHADGAIGHFSVGQTGRTDLWLHEDATQFVVLEAKLFSGLSAGTSRIPYFDQAARNVACMAEVLRRSKRPPQKIARLGFFVLAPQEQIDLGIFDAYLKHDAIKAKMQRRVEAYGGEKDRWHAEWFTPLLHKLRIGLLSWEGVIGTLAAEDPTAEALATFYEHCLTFNRR